MEINWVAQIAVLTRGRQKSCETNYVQKRDMLIITHVENTAAVPISL